MGDFTLAKDVGRRVIEGLRHHMDNGDGKYEGNGGNAVPYNGCVRTLFEDFQRTADPGRHDRLPRISDQRYT